MVGRAVGAVCLPLFLASLAAACGDSESGPIGPCLERGMPVLPELDVGEPAGLQSLSDRDQELLAEADRRIAEIRQGDALIRVTDERGRPQPGAKVEVVQVRHAFPFGSAIALLPDRPDDDTYRAVFVELFNYATTENILKWVPMESVEGHIRYEPVDATLAWTESQGIELKGHTLVWGADPQGVPEWLKEKGSAEVREALRRRVLDTVGRYRGRIHIWDVVNEPIHARWFEEHTGPDYIEQAFRWARQADPEATLMINEYLMFRSREHGLAEAEAYKRLIQERLLDTGAPLDAIGVQGHGAQMPLSWVQEALDTLAELGLPVHITEFDSLPVRLSESGDVELQSPEDQADYYEAALRLFFAHPVVEAITVWGFKDGRHWIEGAGMFDENFEPKPAAHAIRSLLNDRWRTRASDTTDQDGAFAFRGFYGTYAVAVSSGSTQWHGEVTVARSAENHFDLAICE